MKRPLPSVSSTNKDYFSPLPTFETELLALLPRLRRFAQSLSRNAADADDLCQVTVEKALNARVQWVSGTRMDSWMYRIMRNSWIDTTRTRRRAAETFVAEEAGATVVGDDAATVEAGVLGRDIAAAMNALPDEQREAVALVLVEGLAYKEAAAVLDVPMGTLTSRLVRGRQALMAQLEEAA
ncbi:RNA polymerase sigma factor [Sphingomonas sp. SUN039]|uniref:RNA polymerase sigma factor n=1 Tax=Sphingomonas sp. SUN039 TaxID=2937787 RepID=UPI0021640893|nr:RNA polymerase sigma factor [Sphingomonas sp. SUN039]UVO54153.1 RNA polymerase sigma factor [Sphingomonas sp. SUN039]